MTTNPYQVWGASIPPMLGRASLVRRIEDHWLTVEIPRHVSVVGPAHYGKSVLLRHLADNHQTESACYLTTAYIDLRDGPPESDGAFMARLAGAVKDALRPIHSQAAEWFEFEDVTVHECLDYVFKTLEDERKRLLVVFDGFDYALARAELTPNLWSLLRSMAERTSLIFLTGSRRPLRELCSTGESRASPLWNIFHYEPVRVHALDESDWDEFLQPLRDTGCELDESARKEIRNWTGGVPVLVCALLGLLWQERGGTRLSKPTIDQVAETLLEDPSELLGPLWDDCDHALRTDLDALSKEPLTDVPRARRDAVVDRGFGRESRNSIRGSCRLMQRYAQVQAPAIADLTRLLGTAAGFRTHVRSLLEMRLEQVPEGAVDETLRDLVNMAISVIARNPGYPLVWVRGIAERALDVVWEAELPPDRTLPAAWTSEWDLKDVNFPDDQGKVPSSRGQQCNVLRLATGTERTTRSTRYITKTTFLLIDHLQSVGNFGQHRTEGQEVTIGFAAAVILSAISLLECLAHDLAARSS